MAWQAILDEVKNQPEQPINIQVKGRLVNTETNESIAFSTFAHDLTPEHIADLARKQIASLEIRDAAKAAIETGAIDLGLPPPNPVPPERRNFDEAVRVLQTAKFILPIDHPDIVVAQQRVVDTYKREYIGLIE